MEITSDWKGILQSELHQPYVLELFNTVNNEYSSSSVYPPINQIFRALNLTPFSETKVVILGQDPYHGSGQANGLSFSVNKGQKLPPSLKNIYQELVNDIGCNEPNHGDLTAWAKQGVLLLNTVLTVREKEAHSHKQIGWEVLTDRIINLLNEQKTNIVFVLWGNHAQRKGKVINKEKHLVLNSPHPSPLSAYRGFFGSRPFSTINTYLLNHNQTKINWCL
ncbi:uracil-DNA glycosylase [Piscibacillus sp. B03]|uniref:uracil-DNA glycosylase n=1 Tax=Piscibacillus sp. B03 TaxID=3457430 RepID=UPI003FCEA21A